MVSHQIKHTIDEVVLSVGQKTAIIPELRRVAVRALQLQLPRKLAPYLPTEKEFRVETPGTRPRLIKDQIMIPVAKTASLVRLLSLNTPLLSTEDHRPRLRSLR